MVVLARLQDGQGLKDRQRYDQRSDYEACLLGWMALMTFVFFPAPHHLHPDSSVYWFMMQIGMVAGFFTAWPVSTWLIRAGVKEAM